MSDYVEDMVAGFAEAMLWAGLDWDNCTEHGGTEDNPVPLDENYDFDDIHDDAWATIRHECQEFYETHACILDWLSSHLEARALRERGGGFYDARQAGIDFYLTRNGHGAGFWDRGLGILGDILSAGSKPYGETNEYPQDGKIYL